MNKPGARTEAEFRRAIRRWILRSPEARAVQSFTDATPLIEQGLLDSLRVLELLLTIEMLAGTRIEVERLRPGAFHSIDAIATNFFPRAEHMPEGS